MDSELLQRDDDCRVGEPMLSETGSEPEHFGFPDILRLEPSDQCADADQNTRSWILTSLHRTDVVDGVPSWPCPMETL